MRIHTFTKWRIEDDGTWILIEDHAYDYSGPLDLAGNKKARKGEQQVAQTQQQVAQNDITNQNTANTGFQSALAGFNNPASSPLFASDYGQDVENIANTYGNLRQQAFKLLGATGFGNAPSGREATAINTLGNEQAEATGKAYNTALNQAESQFGTEMGAQQAQEQIYNPNTALSGAGTSYKNLYGMGSTLGDIATGITDAAAIGAAPFTGGASLMALNGGGGGGFAGLFNRGGGSTDYSSSAGYNIPGYTSDTVGMTPTGYQTPLPTSTGTPSVNAGFNSLFAPPAPAARSFSPTSSTRPNISSLRQQPGA